MKTYPILIAACLILLAQACTRTEDKAIAGIYTTSFTNGYSKTDDTLIVSAYNLANHIYQIERHTGYNKIRDGKILHREFKQQKWTAIYQKENLVLEAGELGRKLLVKPDERELIMGKTVYHQIQ